MAEPHRSKRVDVPDLADDDPFAELTRIMGHDPRNDSTQAPDDASDDLELDLESELMGDFASREPEPPQADAGVGTADEQPIVRAPHEDGVGDDLPDDLDSVFDMAFDHEMPGADMADGGDDRFGKAETAPVRSDDADEAGTDAGSGYQHNAETDVPNAADATFGPAPSERDAHEGADEEVVGDLEGELSALLAREADAADAPAEFAISDEGSGLAQSDDVSASAPSNPGDEVFDYSRAAADRHSFLEEDAGEPESGAEGIPAKNSQEASWREGSALGVLTNFRPLVEDIYEEPAEPVAEAAGAETVAAGTAYEGYAENVGDRAYPDTAREEPDRAFGEGESAPSVQDESFEPSPIVDEDILGADEPAAPPRGFEEPGGTYRPEEPAQAYGSSDGVAAEPPEVDTVEVPGEPVALPEDLDIPELNYREETTRANPFDDLESELAGAFGETADGDLEHGASMQDASASGRAAVLPADASNEAGTLEAQMPEPEPYPVSAGDAFLQGGYVDDAAGAAGDLAFDPSDHEEMAGIGGKGAGAASGRRRRGVMIAASVVGVAIVGGVAAFALSYGDGGSDSPALVRAGDDPVKVRPENPGGTTVPNQDNEVYQRVSGGESDAEPTQENLVSTTEEPIDIASRLQPAGMPGDPSGGDAGTAAAGKSEERLDTDPDTIGTRTGGNETVAVEPRRVKTMVVRPDGTLVPREEAADESGASASASTDTSSSQGGDGQAAALAPASESGGAGTAAPASSGEELLAAASDLEPNAATTSEAGPETAAEEGAAALAGSEDEGQAASSSQQPADAETAGEGGTTSGSEAEDGEQVASTGPAEEPGEAGSEAAEDTSAATSEWSVQISSQPSREGAERSYQNLAERYGDLLADRGVNIVSAEIPDKGTFYRVRIPSSSKDDAITLCESMKSAGGSCFVSQ